MDSMKFLGLTAAALGVVLAANTEVRAADVHYLKLTRTMVIAGVDLRAAVYTVQWDFQGARATVTFSRKGRVVATVQGERATFDRSVPSDTLYFSRDPDGFLAIKGLAFASTSKGIVFPVVRSHPHPSGGAAVDNPLVNESWRNAPPPVPRVFR
ncbi:MAG: hypothetical protein ACLQVM_07365 [Terriglobia bacterium]